jgi:ABC-2 type transport system permease protein
MDAAVLVSPVAEVEQRLLTIDSESRLFWRLRRKLLLRALGDKLRHSRLRVSLVVVLSIAFWIGLYWLFVEGFRFLAGVPEIIQPLFNTFFASLFLMLIFSSGLILYSSLFRSPETMYLLTQPVRPERVFAHKYHEAVWFSSWGFALMGSPMLVAYGVVAGSPWYYYAFLLPFIVAFVFLPAALGAAACLLVVGWLPRVRLQAVVAVVALVIGGAAWIGWSIFTDTEMNLLTARWFQEISDRLRFTEQRLLPSWWLSAGLLEASRPPLRVYEGYQPWSESLLYFLLLLSNALFLSLVAGWLAAKTYRRSFSRLQCEHTVNRKTRAWLGDAIVRNALVFLPFKVRILLVKELRLFRRDPVQWMQFAIFFGLLALYFINIRRFSYHMNYSAMIGFLNLAVVGLILSTFTTRFIFPMVSLEGRRFWILGLLPLDRDTILRAKFLFAAAGSLVPCSLLILVSDLMLNISTDMLLVHQITCFSLCCGLSGIAVGLGAVMPDLRESSPSKIAAGFGGTLNLVVSALYIMLLVLLTALPWHLKMADDQGLLRDLGGPLLQVIGSNEGIVGGAIATLVIGVVATAWPLRVGMRAFRRLEF